MAINLNIVRADEQLSDITNPRDIKLVDILTEQRRNFNRMFDALSTINTELLAMKNIQAKVDENEQKIDNLINTVIPNMKTQFTRELGVMEAKIMERIDRLEKEKLMENAHSRRLHIIANGVTMQQGLAYGEQEDTEGVFRTLLVSKLKMDPAHVRMMLFRDCHRLHSLKHSRWSTTNHLCLGLTER